MDGKAFAPHRGLLKPAVIVAGLVVACACAYWAAGAWSSPSDVPATVAADIGPDAIPSSPGAAAGGYGPAQRGLPASALLSTRYQLQGVAAGSTVDGAGGIALIAIDGAAARAFRVGDAVGSDLVLRGVGPAGAILGPRDGPPMVVLDVTPGAPGTGAPTSPQPREATAPAYMPAGLPPMAGAAAQPPIAPDTLSVAPPLSAMTEAGVPVTVADLAVDTPPAAVQSPSSRQPTGRHARLQRLNPRP
jgi:general secretion pathway protein C